MLALGIGFFTSAVNVFFKDMAQIVSICLQFGIWMTPIMYHEAMFTGAGKWVEVLFKLNPFYYVVAGYRDTMLTGNWFWERPTLTLYYLSLIHILWWVFNHASLICPAFRLWISRRLGMRLVDSRRKQKAFGSGK